MNNGKWWLLLLSAFFLCILFGSPELWSWWIIALTILIVLSISGKFRAETAAEPGGPASPVAEYIRRLKAEKKNAADSSERRGLQTALRHVYEIWPEHAPESQAMKVEKQAVRREPAYELEDEDDEGGLLPAGKEPEDIWRSGSDISAIVSRSKRTDQTAVLLYAGALLLIGAASLFLVHEGFSGVFKFCVLSFVCAAFYASGLYLHGLKEKLRPAAISFVAIGLLLLPICGISASMLLGVSGSLSWLLTSLLGIILYTYATMRLKSTAISYFTVAMWLSLLMSSVYITDTSYTLQVWVSMLYAIGLQVIHKKLRGSLSSAVDPAYVSSQIIIPLAALATLFVSHGVVLWQLSISLILAACYYALVARDTTDVLKKNTFAIISHSVFVFGLLGIVHDNFRSAEMLVFALLTLSLLHACMVKYLTGRTLFRSGELYGQAMYILASGLALVSLPFAFGKSLLLASALLAAVMLHVLLYRFRPSGYFAPSVAVIMLLFVPVPLQDVLAPYMYGSFSMLAVLYLAVFGILFSVRHLAQSDVIVMTVARYGYVAASAGVFVMSFMAEWGLLVALQLALLLLNEIVSRYERQPLVSFLTPIFAYIALYVYLGETLSQTPSGFEHTAVASGVIAGATLLYALFASSMPRVIMMLGWTSIFTLTAWIATTITEADGYLAPLLLAVYSLLVASQLYRRHMPLILLAVPFAFCMVALQQLIFVYTPSPISASFYAVLWAGYCLGMASWLYARRQTRYASSFSLLAATVTLLAVLIELFAPVALGNQLQSELTVAAIGLLGAAGYTLRTVQDDAQVRVGYQAVYYTTLAGALLITSAYVEPLLATLVALAGALLLAVLSYKDRLPRLIVTVPLAISLSVWHMLRFAEAALPVTHAIALASLVGAITAFLLYRVALREDVVRSKALALTAIALGLVAWVFSIDSSLPGALPIILSPLALVFAAGIALLEAKLLGLSPTGRLLPIAMLNVAFQQYMYQATDGTSWLVYTHLWALYIAYVAWTLKKQGDPQTAHTVKFSALAVFTLPVAFEGLQAPETYGLLLLVEHVALLVLGVFLKRTYLVYWGLAVSVATLMYMLRSFAYVQLAVIAISLIAYAVYRLGRNDKS